MNRAEIKEEARKKIKGNLWNIIWPVLVITVVESLLVTILGGSVNVDFNHLENVAIPTRYYVATSVVSLFIGIVNAGYLKYLIDFTRTGNFDKNTIINVVKEKWLNILIANVLTGLIVAACSLLFVIPGIIMAFAYTLVTYLVVDTDVSGSDALKQSREIMKGYKMDYFIFILSFIGWCLLVPLTFGIILIWLEPYMSVAQIIYYDKLKELKK